MYILTSDVTSTVGPGYNKPLYNKVLGIMSDFLYPIDSKVCVKGPRYKQNLVIASTFCLSLGPSLYRGSTVTSWIKIVI